MSVSGLCEICTSGEVTESCDRCGQLVCDDHYDAETGLCTDCLAEVGGSTRPGERDRPDGVDEYQF